MIAGVPQIVTAGSVYQKIVRTLVLVICLAGFIYQAIGFMKLYLQYETVLDVQVLNTKEIELPSFTICNTNGLYASKICNDSRFQRSCYRMANSPFWGIDYCDCFPGRWCRNGTMQEYWFPTVSVYKKINEMAFKDYSNILQNFDDFITECKIYMSTEDEISVPCNLSYYQQTRSRHSDSCIDTCWTLNTIIGRSGNEPTKVLSSGRISLIIDPHEEEYAPEEKLVTAAIKIHGPRQIINPFFQGLMMKINTKQEIHLKKLVKHLLPFPYQTKCIDYLAKWRARGGHGPTNNKECIEECQKNLSVQAFGCLHPTFTIPGKERICDLFVSSVNLPFSKMIRLAIECARRHCGPACYEESYEVKRTSKSLYNTNKCNKEIYKKGVIEVKLHFDGMETTTYVFSPKFESVEAFSYIGGYIGMWLGISLITLFDFLEAVAVILSYPFQKYKQSSKRKRHLRHRKNHLRNF